MGNSVMRPETSSAIGETAMPDNQVFKRLLMALRRRKTLIHGHLDQGNRSCAMGAFWKDNNGIPISTELLDEIASVNDSVPRATQQERWATVVAWVEWKVNTLKFK